MTVPLYHVDAFTDRLFGGNPAAVCLLKTWPEDRWLAGVAADMNLSETAFLVPEGGGFRLRWFTPAVEVDLCGHATLASAHVLWQSGTAPAGRPITFHTRSGPLTAVPAGDLIELDFPLKPEQPADPPPGLVDALGAEPRYVGNNRMDYLVELASDRAVRTLAPDVRKLAAAKCRGVIVTARSDDPAFDFVSRFFAPAAGVDEDPVTGSAHCCLGAFWRTRLGKDSFVAYQASKRGGVVRVRVSGDRCTLGGRAVTVARGELMIGV